MPLVDTLLDALRYNRERKLSEAAPQAYIANPAAGYAPFDPRAQGIGGMTPEDMDAYNAGKMLLAKQATVNPTIGDQSITNAFSQNANVPYAIPSGWAARTPQGLAALKANADYLAAPSISERQQQVATDVAKRAYTGLGSADQSTRMANAAFLAGGTEMPTRGLGIGQLIPMQRDVRLYNLGAGDVEADTLAQLTLARRANVGTEIAGQTAKTRAEAFKSGAEAIGGGQKWAALMTPEAQDAIYQAALMQATNLPGQEQLTTNQIVEGQKLSQLKARELQGAIDRLDVTETALFHKALTEGRMAAAGDILAQAKFGKDNIEKLKKIQEWNMIADGFLSRFPQSANAFTLDAATGQTIPSPLASPKERFAWKAYMQTYGKSDDTTITGKLGKNTIEIDKDYSMLKPNSTAPITPPITRRAIPDYGQAISVGNPRIALPVPTTVTPTPEVAKRITRGVTASAINPPVEESREARNRREDLNKVARLATKLIGTKVGKALMPKHMPDTYVIDYKGRIHDKLPEGWKIINGMAYPPNINPSN